MSHFRATKYRSVQIPSTSIFVMHWPGTTIRPRKRLVISTSKVLLDDVSVDDSAAALMALGVGSRYSKDWDRMMLHS